MFDCSQQRTRRRPVLGITIWLGLVLALAEFASAAAEKSPTGSAFPPPLESYQDGHLTSVPDVLRHRVQVQPFNLWATLLFLGAVAHTFFCHKFRHWAHALEHRQQGRHAMTGESPASSTKGRGGALPRILHFLGEVEVVFGLWVIPLAVLMNVRLGHGATLDYLSHRVNYQEALFVVVIMAMASTRPVLALAEASLRRVANLAGGAPMAWWLSILTLGPLLGSLITEPAAMTISALLLARQFYTWKPRAALAYATLGLLFVNVSVGGTLTHFAAPPVLMVAAPWKWGTAHMLVNFGWKAVLAIVVSNALYVLWFRRDFAELQRRAAHAGVAGGESPGANSIIPAWVTAGHVLFMAVAVLSVHHSALLIGSFLFFLGFYEITHEFQSDLQLRSPILVGFFLAGLVIHGGLQQWWIAPVLGSLQQTSLMLGSIILTSVNDNAAITYLATLVPNLSDAAKYAMVAGAVTGGGLTVIANAPNPAGQAILGRYFPDGISPLNLLLGALIPTVLTALVFLLFA